MSVVDLGIITSFALWTLLTGLAQPHLDLAIRIRKLDPIGFLPSWTFFAPNPGWTDYWLLYRDRADDGQMSAWTRAQGGLRRPLRSILFHPEKRTMKAVHDSVQALVRISLKHRDNVRHVRFSLPYVMLALYVASIQRREVPASTQFVIVEVFPRRVGVKPRVIFQSAFHPPPGASPCG